MTSSHQGLTAVISFHRHRERSQWTHLSIRHNACWCSLFRGVIWIYAVSHSSRIQLFSNYLTYLDLIKRKARKVVAEVTCVEVQGCCSPASVQSQLDVRSRLSTRFEWCTDGQEVWEVTTACWAAFPLKQGLWRQHVGPQALFSVGHSWRLHRVCWPLGRMGNGTTGPIKGGPPGCETPSSGTPPYSPATSLESTWEYLDWEVEDKGLWDFARKHCPQNSKI